jgi:1,4-alpha-glucan branching enzyme
MFDNLPDPGAIDAIVQARHGDPFALLGPHPATRGITVNAFIPNVDSVEVLARDTGLPLGRLKRVHATGFWSGNFATLPAYRFRVGVGDASFETEDPYSYPPLLGDMDIYLLAEGRHRDFSAALGAHVITIDGVTGTRFAVWAPNASRVSVVGDFNFWDGRRNPMRLRHGPGVWEIFIPRVTAGTVYKYEIRSAWGETLPLKADPVAQATERPPRTGSVVPDPTPYEWADQDWMAGRSGRPAGALCPPHGLHPCRIDAGDGTPFRRFLGLSAAFAIRSHRPLRPAGWFREFRRSLPPGWSRRDTGLGPRAFPHRRAWPSPL